MHKCVAVLLVFFALTAPGSGAFFQTTTVSGWADLDRQAEERFAMGDRKGAAQIARLAMAAASDPGQSARSMNRLGLFEYLTGNIAEGESLLRRAIDLRRTGFGADSIEYAESANDLAIFCRE